MYQSAIFELGAWALAALAAALALAVLALAIRPQRAAGSAADPRACRGRPRSPGCRRLPGRAPAAAGWCWMSAQPAAYCVPGRPATIVLTSGALAVLDPAQLTAVLAHERAHLAGRTTC